MLLARLALAQCGGEILLRQAGTYRLISSVKLPPVWGTIEIFYSPCADPLGVSLLFYSPINILEKRFFGNPSSGGM